ncbi:MAG: alanine racemase [Gaiellaceae bacterium]
MTNAASTHRARAHFDLTALRANLVEIERRVGPNRKIIASVKADAYGHGAIDVARALESAGVFALATGSLGEAVQIRQAGVETPILLFPGFDDEAVPEILNHELTAGIDRIELARELSRHAPEAVRVWVKVDAGLGRHGVPLDDVVAFVEALRELPRVELEGVFTHLPFVDSAGRQWAESCLARFTSALRALEERGLKPPHSQALSSAGALAGLDDPNTAICPGHALYGIPAASAEVVAMDGLEPVASSITTTLAHVAAHPNPRSIGVGGSRDVAAGAITGVVPLGRRDGYRWHTDQAAAMIIAGERAPVIGLSLEHAMLDITQIPGARVGADVAALGRDGDASITLAELGSWRRSSPVETLLDFAGRVKRCYRDAHRSPA